MKRVTLGAAIGLLVLGLAAQAPADNLQVSIDGAPACVDNTGCDSNSTLGVVVVTVSSGTATITSGTAIGTPFNNPLDLDIQFSAATSPSSVAGVTTIEVSENNLSTSGQPVTWTGNVGGTNSNTSTTVQAYGDAGNGLFIHTTSLCGPMSSSAANYGQSCTSGSFNDGSFSLSMLVTVTRGGGVSLASGDFGLTAVPEPGALLLVGSALAGIGLAGGALRRRFGWTTA